MDRLILLLTHAPDLPAASPILVSDLLLLLVPPYLNSLLPPYLDFQLPPYLNERRSAEERELLCHRFDEASKQN